MHQRLGHRSTRSLIAGDTANFWEDAELKIDPDPFCTSCKISSIGLTVMTEDRKSVITVRGTKLR